MKISNFPCLNQTYDYDCGAKVVEAVLAHYGKDVDEQTIMKTAGTTNRYGTTVEGVEKALKKFGLRYVAKKMTIAEVKKNIDSGTPVILLLQAYPEEPQNNIDWKNFWSAGHYVVAIGYDQRKMYFEDPMNEMRTYLTFAELEDRWHDKLGRKKKIYHNLGIAVFGQREAFDFKRAVPMG
jgi:uncharacterized protein